MNPPTYFDLLAADGLLPSPHPAGASRGPTEQELKLGYALAKQVPAMAQGFAIHTQYGTLVVQPGRLAERLQSAVGNALKKELDVVGRQKGKEA